jgi:hypothetical protein
MKTFLATLGRAVVYSLVFWLVYSLLYRPFWVTTTDKEDPRTEKSWKAYEDQQARSSSALETALAQQQRMSAIMTKQEELNRRFEKVIERWEGQANAKR